MPAFEITAAGFDTPRLPEARARVVELWRSRFGNNADTGSASPDGLMIDVLSLLLALSWQGIGAAYASAYFDTAQGVSLDLVLGLFGRRRLAATESTVGLIWYGTNATTVPSGSQARVEDTDTVFATDAAVDLDEDVALVVRVDDVENSTAYTVTLDGNAHTYTSDGSATMAEIVAGIVAALDGEAEVSAVYDAGLDPDGLGLVYVELASAVTHSTSANLTAYAAGLVDSTATTTGALQALAGSVNVIVTPAAGVTGVATISDAIAGRALETDSELRARHLSTLSRNGARSPEALAARAMELAGAEAMIVRENEGPTVDANGLPPHSFELLALGGDDDEIAALIWNQKPAGIRAYGTTEVDVLDSRGRSHVIGFTRPTVLYGWARVTITAGEGYPTSGTPLDTIADALALALGSGGARAPRMGQDVYRVGLYGLITSAVPGVAGIVIELATTLTEGGTPTYAEADITVDDDEIVRFASTRIEVL